MRRLPAVAWLLASIALVSTVGAAGAPQRPSGTLEIDVTVRQYWRLDRAFCAPGLPSAATCLRSEGNGAIAGLGRVTVTYRKVLPGDDENCFMIQNNAATIEVMGSGTLELSRPGRICAPGPPPREDGPWAFTIADGSGRYARASGGLTYKSSVYAGDAACQCGTAIDRWTGTLTVADLEFDTTRPVLSGAVSKVVRAPKGTRRVRVRYVVTAKDAVDGPLRVSCKPRSGSFFKRGRTTVRCSATDSSANAAGARFTITVR